MEVRRQYSRSAIAFALFLANLLARAAAADSPVTGQLLYSTRIPKNGDHVVLSAKIDGQKAACVFDTGATHLCIDHALADKLKLEPQGSVKGWTAGGSTNFATVACPVLMLGHTTFSHSDQAFVADLASISELKGRTLSALIGMTFWKNHIVELDFDHSRMNVFTSSSSIAAGWKFVDIAYMTNGVPYITARTGDFAYTLTIDTGSDCTIDLPRQALQPLIQGQTVDYYSPSLSWSLSGMAPDPTFLLSKVSLGTFEFGDIVVGRSGYGHSRGTLGIGLLSKFHVIFDFPNSRLYLKPRELAISGKRGFLGVVLKRENSTTSVAEIVRDSPADRLGLRRGDILFNVPSGKAEGLPLNKIYQELQSRPGKERTITIEREGMRQSVVVIPERPIPVPIALSGDCPVMLKDNGWRLFGDPEHPVVYNGRCYFCFGPIAAEEFKLAPERYAITEALLDDGKGD